MNVDARLLSALRERGVLGQEAVAGVDGLGAGALDHLEQLVDVQVGLGRRPGAEQVGLGRALDVLARRGRPRSRPRRTAMPSSSSARITRTAISPRLATRTLENMRRATLPRTRRQGTQAPIRTAVRLPLADCGPVRYS